MASTAAFMIPGWIVRPFIAIALTLAAIVFRSTALAQDLEPRAYSNSPTGLNFVILGYGYGQGSVLTDPSLPLDNVSNDSHAGLFAFATTLNVLGKSAKFDFILPYYSLTAEGLVNNQPRSRHVTGFGDPSFRFSINFIGAPALTMAEFSSYRQDFIFGASLRIGIPVGQYNAEKLVNIGSNRWSLKPELGFSKAFGKWTAEVVPAVTFYTDNGDFYGGKTRAQTPLYSAQAGLSYTFVQGCWLAINAGYYNGGRSTLDGVLSDDRQEGTRFGATFAFPVTRKHSVKFYTITGFNAHREHDYQAFGIAWQYRWGGGF
jgi:hypothetical protein